MVISEVINKLQEIQKEYGDLEVLVESNDYCFDFNLLDLTVFNTTLYIEVK